MEPMTTRDALLDAAYQVIVAGEWGRARMVDVAAAAGVSRQTLYNEFGSKDALVEAMAVREAGCFLTGIRAAMEADRGEPAQAVYAGVAWALRAASVNPLVKAVLTDDASGLLPFVTTRAEPVLHEIREGITSFLLSRRPELNPAGAREVAEVGTRLTVSYLVLPSEPVEATASRIAHVVARLLDRTD